MVDEEEEEKGKRERQSPKVESEKEGQVVKACMPPSIVAGWLAGSLEDKESSQPASQPQSTILLTYSNV